MVYIPIHFTAPEFVPKEIYDVEGDSALSHLHDTILEIADQVREFYGDQCEMIINNWHTGGPFSQRGFRTPDCPEYTPGSMHAIGGAIDCDVYINKVKVPADKVRSDIMFNQDKFPNIYRMEAGVAWVHIDDKGFGEHPRNGISLFTA